MFNPEINANAISSPEDHSAEMMQLETDLAVQAIRAKASKPEYQPVFNRVIGEFMCLFCDSPIGHVAKCFCDNYCSEDFEYRRKRHAANVT